MCEKRSKEQYRNTGKFSLAYWKQMIFDDFDWRLSVIQGVFHFDWPSIKYQTTAKWQNIAGSKNFFSVYTMI